MIGDVAAGVFLVAVVYVLVRPQSQAAELVQITGDMMVRLVKRAADL